jgi:hypothetical protein
MNLMDAEIKDAESIKKAQHRKALRDDAEPKKLIIWIIRLLGIFTIIGGITFGMKAVLFGDVYIFSGILGGIFLIGIAEGLDLLQKIYTNTRK